MHYTSTILFFLLSFSSVSAQLGYLGYGYRWNFSPLEGENAFIEDYNALRPWLDKEMEELKSVNGFGISGGLGANSVWLGFDWFGRKNMTYATGLEPSTSTNVERELLIRNNVTNINVGVATGDQAMGITFGLQSSIVTQKVKTRVYAVGDDKGEWEEPADNYLNVSLGPAMNLLVMVSKEAPIAINLHVAYTWGVFATNWGKLDEEINGTNYNYEDYPDKFNSIPNYFSFGLGIWLFFLQ